MLDAGREAFDALVVELASSIAEATWVGAAASAAAALTARASLSAVPGGHEEGREGRAGSGDDPPWRALRLPHAMMDTTEVTAPVNCFF